MKKLISTNPAKNYEIIGSVNISTENEIKQKVNAAQNVKISWKESGNELPRSKLRGIKPLRLNIKTKG